MKPALAILLLAAAAPVRSPKDASDPAHANAKMVRTVQPPLPPGYSPVVAAAPVTALTVTTLAVPSAPYDILPPLITATNICFPVLSQFTTNTILASTDLVHWTPFTNYCQPSDHMFFKLQH